MAFAAGEGGAIETQGRSLKGRHKSGKIGNPLENLHPNRGVFAAGKAARPAAAMRGHGHKQGVDPGGGCRFPRGINAVVDIDGLHLFGERVGQGLQTQRCTVHGLQAQGLRVRAFDLGDGQEIEAAAGRRRGVDHRA